MTKLGRIWKLYQLLSRIVTICSFCKKVRDENGEWIPVEEYFHQFGIQFSHGFCPPCGKKNYPEYVK